MTVSVRLYAALRQAAGRDTLDLELPDGSNIGDLRRRLTGELPALNALSGLLLFAIDASYAADGQVIPTGSQVACFPPVGGG